MEAIVAGVAGKGLVAKAAGHLIAAAKVCACVPGVGWKVAAVIGGALAIGGAVYAGYQLYKSHVAFRLLRPRTSRRMIQKVPHQGLAEILLKISERLWQVQEEG